MEMASSVLGSCTLAAVVVLVRLAQDRMDRRREQDLDAARCQCESLAACVKKNGQIKL